MKLLLASNSNARRNMLEAAGVPFEVAATHFDENVAKSVLGSDWHPLWVAEELAKGKALGVSASSEDLVLGADQVLEYEGMRIDKAESREHAAQYLQWMSGATHYLHSAASVVSGGEIVWSHVETAAMVVRPLSPAFIDAYLDEEWEKVRWSVGSYHFEGRGAQLFERVEGSHFAVLGLPLLPLLSFLRSKALLAS